MFTLIAIWHHIYWLTSLKILFSTELHIWLRLIFIVNLAPYTFLGGRPVLSRHAQIELKLSFTTLTFKNTNNPTVPYELHRYTRLGGKLPTGKHVYSIVTEQSGLDSLRKLYMYVCLQVSSNDGFWYLLVKAVLRLCLKFGSRYKTILNIYIHDRYIGLCDRVCVARNIWINRTLLGATWSAASCCVQTRGISVCPVNK